jgi:hypothetical protein
MTTTYMLLSLLVLRRLFHLRYDIMFTVKSFGDRKVTVMDFKKARMITFTLSELEGNEMEDDLKEFTRTMLEKINTGYYDYTGKHNQTKES